LLGLTQKVRKKVELPNYDWWKIQVYHDNGHTWREITDKFGCSSTTISSACKKGLLSTRSRHDANVLSNKKNPRTHSEETKEKISKARKKYLEDNPDKVPYKLNHYSKGDSYPERYFKKLFKNEGIPLKHHLQVSLYELDFYNEEKMKCLEIDGEQHYVDDRIVESDQRRTEYLTGRGWDVCRIRWSEWKKLTEKQKKEEVEKIKKWLI
jgi:very-short-patch-repair endonuclease